MKGEAGILVLGGRGRLGRAVLEQAGEEAVAAPSLGRPAGAQEAAEGFQELAGFIRRQEPRLVINCLGYTAVDRAQDEADLARELNARGPAQLARACAEAGAQLVHVSTDHVFDGRLRRPYREDDPPAPLSVYGRSKLEGERAVAAACPSALVVRSAWFFGPGRPGFVEKVLRAARRGVPVPVVEDQWGSPTYTRDLARALLDLGRRRVGGLLHVVNSGRASRYELARQALRLAGLDPELVRPVASSQVPGAELRPAWTVLDTRRYARLAGGPLPTWLEALERYLTGDKEA